MLLLQLLALFQTFEAASVKPVAQPRRVWAEPTGGPGTKEPGRIHYPSVTLQFLLLKAYNASPFQIAGPNWLESERFDVDATLPSGATGAQFRAMLQNLLSERFKLEIHHETRQLSGYALVVARSGPKVREAALVAPPNDGAPPPPLKLGANGYFIPPERPGVFLQLTGTSGARSTFRQASMTDLTATLQRQLKRPVSDATGMAGKYDFVLTCSTDGLDLGSGRIPVSGGGADSLPDIFSALQERLGLKLEPKKVPVDVIVVDHAQKNPIENL